MPHVLALVLGGGGPERRGHLGLTDPVGAPGAGPRLDYVRHMAFVILFVLAGLLFVAEDDFADGHGGERGAPRAVAVVEAVLLVLLKRVCYQFSFHLHILELQPSIPRTYLARLAPPPAPGELIN